jgi:hypothetical protein
VPRRPLLLLLAALVALLLLPAAAQAISYDTAVDRLIKDGYPQKIVKDIARMGTSKQLGFRIAGSPADNQAARYIAARMRAMGLSGVKLERVPLDVWDYRSASVTVSGGAYTVPTKYTASPFGGARGTGAMPVTAPIVYVGSGTEAEFDAAGDVTGKIVLVDLDGYNWWMNFPQMLAGERGAIAVVMTHAAVDLPAAGEYFTADDALGSFDGETDFDAPPMVYIARGNGADLRAACLAGPVTATVKADIRIRLEEDGGYGYNVIGKIPGTTNKTQMVLFSSHHDAWFRGVEDDTSAVGTELTVAKAMMMSKLKPKKTVVFLFTTAEEFGTTNSWYDWLIGAYHFIDKAHPDWAGRIAGQINLEWQGLKETPFQIRCNPEMAPYIEGIVADPANAALVPYGLDSGGVRRNVWTWNDQWPLTAKGVPSVYFVNKDDAGTYRGAWYHTNYDDLSLIDWKYIGSSAKLYRRVHRGLDQGLLPYDFEARATALADNVDAAGLLAAGADPALVTQLERRIERFTAAAGDWKARRGLVNAGQYGKVNARLMEAERIINSSMTALDQWDGACYPHSQVYEDVVDLNDTLAALEDTPVDPDGAMGALYDVGPFWYGDMFGKQVYQRQLVRQTPTYYRINWGGLGHLEPYPDVYDDYHAIESADYAAAIASLEPKRDELLEELDVRLADMSVALGAATLELRAVTPIGGPRR